MAAPEGPQFDPIDAPVRSEPTPEPGQPPRRPGKDGGSPSTTQLVASWVGAGAICGLVVVMRAISFAALIWPDNLLPHGTLALLWGSVVGQLLATAISGMPVTIIGPSSAALPFNALMAKGIFDALGEKVPPADLARAAVPTLVVAQAFAALAVGGTMLLVARFRLARAFQFLPYTVVQGFFAAVGTSLCLGAITSTASSGQSSLTWAAVGRWFHPDALGRIAVMVLFGLGMRVLARATAIGKHYLFFPMGTLTSIGIFFAVLYGLHGTGHLAGDDPVSTAQGAGWLFSAYEQLDVGAVWRIGFDFRDVHWLVMLDNLRTIVPMVLVTTVDLAVSLPALEECTGLPLNLHREFAVSALANLASAFTASGTMYLTLSSSKLNVDISVAPGRVPALVSALVCFIALWAGPTLLTWTPRFIVSGILFYLGSGFVLEACWDSLKMLSYTELGIVLSMVGLSIAFNTIEAVGIGLAAACALFALRSAKYTRATSIVYVADAREVLSHMGLSLDADGSLLEAPSATADTLEEVKVAVHPILTPAFTYRKAVVIALRGYFFFGNAHMLRSYVESLLAIHRMPTGSLPDSLEYRPSRPNGAADLQPSAPIGTALAGQGGWGSGMRRVASSASLQHGGANLSEPLISQPRPRALASRGSYSNLAGMSAVLPPADEIVSLHSRRPNWYEVAFPWLTQQGSEAEAPAGEVRLPHTPVSRRFTGMLLSGSAAGTGVAEAASHPDERSGTPPSLDAPPVPGPRRMASGGSVRGLELGPVGEEAEREGDSDGEDAARAVGTGDVEDPSGPVLRKLGAVIVDVTRVDGLDASACSTVAALRVACREAGVHLIIVGAAPESRLSRRLVGIGFAEVASAPSTHAVEGPLDAASVASGLTAAMDGPRLAKPPRTGALLLPTALDAISYLAHPNSSERVVS